MHWSGRAELGRKPFPAERKGRESLPKTEACLKDVALDAENRRSESANSASQSLRVRLLHAISLNQRECSRLFPELVTQRLTSRANRGNRKWPEASSITFTWQM